MSRKAQITPAAEERAAAAVALHRRGLLNEAVQAYSQILAGDPLNDQMWSNLGVALKSQGKYQAAEAAYRRAVAVNPGNAGALSNLGNVLRRLGKLSEAVSLHKRAVKAESGFAAAYYNLGLVLCDLGRTAEAVKLFDKALSLSPEDHKIRWDRSLALLLGGDLEQGFKEYEWRWQREESKPRVFQQPTWQGEDLAGRTLLVYSEQGFGDTIQFCRYLPMIEKSGGRMVFECQPELAGLMRQVEGPDQVVARGERLPDFDVQIPLLSLPGIMGTDLESVPGDTPYLSPPAGSGFHVAKPPETALAVGISWAGKPSHKNDHNRTVDIRRFLDLAALPGVVLYSLQKGEGSRDRLEHACGILVRDLGGGLNDFGDTAAILNQLDLVVSVDTSVVHLAGALNRPVWVLLPYAPDWRWMREREDSPWYPGMRLFRQKRFGDWDGVFAKVKKSLEKLLAGEGEEG